MVLTETLIGELWAEQVPSHVENALQAHVSRLRGRLATLEPERTCVRLVTHPSGYQLLVEDDELDSAVFTRELERIRSEAAAGPAQRAKDLRRILALWRGPVLGGVTAGPLCQAATARYEESRMSALELLFDNELQNGNHANIIPELRELLSRYTYQERFGQQLMIALYRSGRQADALKVYRELWRKLTEELGLEPSPAMRDYERAVLNRDPLLNPPSGTVSGHETIK